MRRCPHETPNVSVSVCARAFFCVAFDSPPFLSASYLMHLSIASSSIPSCSSSNRPRRFVAAVAAKKNAESTFPAVGVYPPSLNSLLTFQGYALMHTAAGRKQFFGSFLELFSYDDYCVAGQSRECGQFIWVCVWPGFWSEVGSHDEREVCRIANECGLQNIIFEF